MRREHRVVPPEGHYLAPHVTVRDIQEAVCKAFRLPMIDMVSARRGKTVAHPRQIAMYLARELTPYSFPNIGRFFGNRDHTTVLYAVEQVEKRVCADPDLAQKVMGIRDELLTEMAVAA